MSEFLQDLKNSQKSKGGRVAFPESTDLRVLQAINQLLSENIISQITVFTPKVEFLKLAEAHSMKAILKHQNRLSFVATNPEDLESFLKESMKYKPVSASALQELIKSPLYQAGYMLAKGEVDCVLAGACTETSHVIRAALRTVSKAEGLSTISGSFIMERKDEIFLFADCGVNIDPTLDELVDIAYESKTTWESIPFLAKRTPHIAFLSFSTKGSAKHKFAMKMADAAELLKARVPNLSVDGELQFDAAFDIEVGKRKAPQSSVAGRANIFIFPDLNSGNLAYKITQRLGGFSAYGPLLQGLNKPYCDLSRGATVSDIVACTYINLNLRN